MTARTDTTPAAPQRWIFAMTVAFLYAGVVLRSLLAFDGSERVLALVLLAVWLLLLLSEPPLARVWPTYFALYAGLQAAVVGVLLWANATDFFTALLAIPSMQAMLRWRPRGAIVLIGLFTVLTGVCLYDAYGLAQAVAFAALSCVADAFLAAFALAMRRASEARLRSVALAGELADANRQMADYAHRLERLAGARERQRLARDLHDSVTQTLFSMTLTARSAALLLGRDTKGLKDQVDQIENLADSALSEMRTLGGEQATSALADGGLVTSLERHLAERAHRDGLSVSLELDGDGRLPEREEQTLLRIVQEALNNVVKHAGVSSAVVRVRLRRPFSVEIEDGGRGFDPASADEGGVGLTSMGERADEIGWRLSIVSAPGTGTRVLAEEMTGEEGESGA
jgi:signal transduction histidine kinase